jgi:hypothetical protein
VKRIDLVKEIAICGGKAFSPETGRPEQGEINGFVDGPGCFREGGGSVRSEISDCFHPDGVFHVKQLDPNCVEAMHLNESFHVKRQAC